MSDTHTYLRTQHLRLPIFIHFLLQKNRKWNKIQTNVMNLFFAQCKSHLMWFDVVWCGDCFIFACICCWIAWKDAINYMIWMNVIFAEVCLWKRNTKSDNSSVPFACEMIVIQWLYYSEFDYNFSYLFAFSFLLLYIQFDSPSI